MDQAGVETAMMSITTPGLWFESNERARKIARHANEYAATMRANPTQIPSAGFIVVAVRPGNQTRTWFDFKPALADATMAALTHAVEATPTMPVKSGQIVFALRVSVWSDKPPAAYAPAPQAWKDATRGMKPKPDVDTLVDMVWPR